MINRGSSFAEVIEAEKQLLIDAEVKYGKYFDNAFDFIDLLQGFLGRVKPEGWIFTMFLFQFRKHILLAFWSTLHLHHIQAMLDLRVAMEAGINAAYAISSDRQEDFVTQESGVLEAPRKLDAKRYKWLEEHYPKGTTEIKGLKKIINRSSAHSNMIYAFRNWHLDPDRGFRFSYFDREDEKITKTDLWQIANVTMGLLDLFYGINRDYKVLEFSKDFVSRLKAYEVVNIELKEEAGRLPPVKP